MRMLLSSRRWGLSKIYFNFSWISFSYHVYFLLNHHARFSILSHFADKHIITFFHVTSSIKTRCVHRKIHSKMNFIIFLFASAFGNRRFRHFQNFHKYGKVHSHGGPIADRADRIAIGNLLQKYGFNWLKYQWLYENLIKLFQFILI